MVIYLWGALTLACAVAGLLFLRFWRVSGERLFLFFSLAFIVFGLNYASLGLLNPPAETRYYFYVLRLVAFALMIVAIVDKNRRAVASRRIEKASATD